MKTIKTKWVFDKKKNKTVQIVVSKRKTCPFCRTKLVLDNNGVLACPKCKEQDDKYPLVIGRRGHGMDSTFLDYLKESGEK